MEVIKFNESDRHSPAERITLALAKVQGAWNKKSKSLLLATNGIGRETFSAENDSVMEKIIENILEKAANAFIGDGSMANALLGRRVALPVEDQGLIILYELSNGSDSVNFADWANSAIILNAIEGGESYQNIRSNFSRKFENLESGFESVVKILNKFFPDDDAGVGTSNFETNEMLTHLDELYGGSIETLKGNKKNLEETLITRISVGFGLMSQADLIKASQVLKSGTDDNVVSQGLDSARSLFSVVMKSKVEVINEVLRGL